jgi:hypothetical protein
MKLINVVKKHLFFCFHFGALLFIAQLILYHVPNLKRYLSRFGKF